MVFIETPIFTKLLPDYLPDDSYRELQADLIDNPESGAIIEGTGGLRKKRWALPGGGKSGGARIIYYWRKAHDQIIMLFVYPKSDQEDLTPAQKKALSSMVKEWK